MKKTKSLVVSLLAALAVIVMVSSADAISFNIDNGGISPSSTNYGTIDLSMNSTNIDVDITMANGYLLGGDFGFGVVGSVEGLSVSNLSTGDNSWNLKVPSGEISTFGIFDAQLYRNPKASNRVAELSFTISRTAGFTAISDLLEYNADIRKPYFVTHVFPTATIAPVPEPATMILLGLGFVGLAGVRRKFKK
jgi:hypothetical protein